MHVARQLLGADKLLFLAHFLKDGLLFLFSGTLHALGQRLLRKTLLINAIHGIVDVQKIFCHEQRAIGQERQERHLLLGYAHFGYYLHLLSLVLRQLAVHFERADGIDVIAKEINAERQLAAERIDVEYAAT